jgi:hypothetical protein
MERDATERKQVPVTSKYRCSFGTPPDAYLAPGVVPGGCLGNSQNLDSCRPLNDLMRMDDVGGKRALALVLVTWCVSFM